MKKKLFILALAMGASQIHAGLFDKAKEMWSDSSEAATERAKDLSKTAKVKIADLRKQVSKKSNVIKTKMEADEMLKDVVSEQKRVDKALNKAKKKLDKSTDANTKKALNKAYKDLRREKDNLGDDARNLRELMKRIK